MAARRLPVHYKITYNWNKLTDFHAICVQIDVFEVREYIYTHFKCLPVFLNKEKYINPFKMAAGEFRYAIKSPRAATT